MDSAINADIKEEVDDLYFPEFKNVLSNIGDTVDSCSTECVSGDWSVEVKQENLAVVKQEPDDVCCNVYILLFMPKTLLRKVDLTG